MPGPGAYLVGEEERREVEDVLETGYVSRYGTADNLKFKRKVVTLEQEFAKYSGVKHCVALSGGTGAIMAALVALGVGPGVKVLVPGYTFVASISAVISVGGQPILTEIDESLTMDPQDLEKKITKETKVIMPVHMLGNPCDMDAIMEVAKKHELLVLEDCCQALGASYKGKKVGSIGDIGAFSLNINKTITCGDGGLVTTNDQHLYERAFGFHDQGHLPLRMGVEIGKRSLIGINLRLNELTGAFALGQLQKLDHILQTLRAKKTQFKHAILAGDIKNMTFRKINDPDECHTLLTVLFKDAPTAQRVAETLGTTTLDHSGWHVYNNMEQILAYTDSAGNKLYHKYMLPQTDDILSRAINLSVGVVDPGLGASFGINILSSHAEIETTAEKFIRIVKPLVD
ncbi:DegT/DnrJ/EryC1/StrS aminotransferase [Candidatus Vecturithrix granuli]|uniref:DegT/DnrJ/EryC1/StrS aminotransferase n=1 Tax=Vecturithrix granuli TaxID=1499967 RepID=A0A081C4P3_VECG1|nr:DegT/DnrJ/EryC1/StrS aminotransferase [Candidatus Vecturithrix granuli]